MVASKNPIVTISEVLAISSCAIFPFVYVLISQHFPDDISFALVFVCSCLFGLINAFTLLLKFELPKFAFPGIAIHLFALFMVTCYCYP